MKAMTEEEKLKRKKTITLIIVYAAITLFAFIVYYLTLPPINPQSEGFWVFLAFLVLIYLAPVGFTATRGITEPRTKAQKKATFFRSGAKIADFYVKPKKILLFALIPIGIMILCGLIGTELFWAKSYASLITVSEREFKNDMQETVNVDNVALMDSESAKILGQRTLGELAWVVSQYTLSENYTQINYKNTPQKVCNLEYDGFFKWAGNRKNGIPGYVLVDPVLNTSKFVEVSEPLKYAESAFFGEDLYRKLRFSYPTKIFGAARFEIDDNGNPFYIVPCMKPRIFLFGGTDVAEAIIFNPTSGESTIYAVADVPSWVDIVFDGELACEKYNWYGELSGGFINSVIGNKGCKRTTDDFGYVIADDDVWYYTGVTSVTGDSSNIGFILTCARTGEYKFYSVHGAEEHSAMGAAEGEVQEKGYNASFPALINVRGQATYIMVLKDANGIVKMYALVNVEQYGIVATGSTQSEAMKKYIALLEEKNITEDKETDELSFEVEEIKQAQLNGNTVFYFKPKGQNVYFKALYTEFESSIRVNVGDSITVTYCKTSEENIYRILSLKID